MSYSQLSLGTTVLPNDVERYSPEKFLALKPGQVKPVKRPSELDEQHITHEAVKQHILHSGSYHLSPFSFNWNQHSRIYSIIAAFKKYSNHVVLSSCRVDAIARDPGLVQLTRHFGSTNLVCAVEGISSRICNFLQKSLMDEELYVGLSHIIQQPFNSVKFYYIYTGLETDEDIDEFERHLAKVDELRRMHGKPTFEMRMSFTPLLSTLGTPLQYHGSKVQRSLKVGSNALYRIKHLCSRYGFSVRLSTSIASSDFSQICELLDRRGQGVLEHASLNGIYTQPRLSIQFYSDESEVTKAEFDRLPNSVSMQAGDKYYKFTPVDRITLNKLYGLINAEVFYPEFSIDQLQTLLLENNGKPIPPELLSKFPPRRQKKLANTKLKAVPQEGDHFYHSWPGGKKQYHMIINLMVDDISIDKIKEHIPLFTNGVTFNDLIEDKGATYIFPSSHIKFHKNRHIGQDFKQYVSNRAYIFDSYCFADALAKCVNCGACDSFTEVQAITKVAADKETGETHMALIRAHTRDNEPYQKLLVEVRVEPGKYAAIPTKWFRYAVNRAILRAGGNDARLVEPYISDRFIHSRQGYKLKSDTFKNIMGGSLLIEMSFNRLHNFTQQEVDRMMSVVNQYTTPGWSISNIILKDGTYILKNNLDYAYTEYRFDERKVNLAGFGKLNRGESFVDLLQKAIDKFYDKDRVVKYRAQSASGRFTTKTELKDYDKSKIVFMTAGIGRNRYETVLRVMSRVEESHPLIFLAGLLGSDTSPKGYTALYGIDVSMQGFYKAPSKGGNLFDIAGDDNALHTHATECPACGGARFLNLVTGLPFGNATYEQDPVLMRKHEGKPVCQECHANHAP